MSARIVDEETIRKWISENGGSGGFPTDLTEDVEVALNGHKLDYLGSTIEEEINDGIGSWYAKGLANGTIVWVDDPNYSVYMQAGDEDYEAGVGLFYANGNGNIAGLAQMYSQADENNWSQFDVDSGRIHAQSTADFSIEADTGIKLATVLEFADNAAALLGGLTAGNIYITGDVLKIVH
jgi:hypothetical protein